MTARRWLSLLFAVFILLFAAALHAAEATGKVEWAYDGDTLRVAGLGKVRLLGIDTPEKETADKDRFYLRQGISSDRLRQVAAAAHRFTIAEAKGRSVRLVFDRERRDDYGRLLAYVYLPDGRMLNLLLLENGYASVYRRADFHRKEEFFASEAAAKKGRRGLWQ